VIAGVTGRSSVRPTFRVERPCFGARTSVEPTLLAGTFGVLVAMVAPAFAQAPSHDAPPAAPPSAREQAQRLMDEGLALVGEAELGAALARFREAHALYPSPKLLINIGSALRYLGRNAEAAGAYEQYLHHPEADAARRAQVAHVLAELERAVGRIVIVVGDADARLRLDGQPLERPGGRVRLRVDPGEHTVVAEKPGKAPSVASLSVRAEEEIVLELRMADGTPEIRVLRESPQPYVGLAVGAVGVAGLVIGGVFAGLASSADADAAEHCQRETLCDESGAAMGETALDHATVATAALSVGAVAAAAGVVLYLSSPRSPEAVLVEARGRGGRLAFAW
jgi:hypothetical protein